MALIKRAVGVTAVKQKVASKTGIPTTEKRLEHKIGGAVLNVVGFKKN